MVNFQTIRDSRPFEHRANGRMLNFLDAFRILYARINNSVLVIKERREMATGNVAVLVYGRRKDRSPVLLKPSGIVGPATKK
jgi:hypothetical protein